MNRDTLTRKVSEGTYVQETDLHSRQPLHIPICDRPCSIDSHYNKFSNVLQRKCIERAYAFPHSRPKTIISPKGSRDLSFGESKKMHLGIVPNRVIETNDSNLSSRHSQLHICTAPSWRMPSLLMLANRTTSPRLKDCSLAIDEISLPIPT